MDTVKRLEVIVKFPFQGPGIDVRGSETYKHRFFNMVTCTVVHMNDSRKDLCAEQTTKPGLLSSIKKQLTPKKSFLHSFEAPQLTYQQSRLEAYQSPMLHPQYNGIGITPGGSYEYHHNSTPPQLQASQMRPRRSFSLF